MSYWTHIRGMITVEPIDDTVLDNVLASLPQVSGSEGGISIYVAPKNHETLKVHGLKGRIKNFDELPAEYIIVVEGNLRDRYFDRTLREFTKWMCRLAKRTEVSHALVEISDHSRAYIIDNNNYAYSDMYVEPSDNKGEKYE